MHYQFVCTLLQMRATVKELATCFPTAIISGRARLKVWPFKTHS